MNTKISIAFCSMLAGATLVAEETVTNAVTDLGTVLVEASALSRYRPAAVNGATFTDAPPEELPTVVDTLTEDYIREHNPTDLHDLMRYVPTCRASRRVANPSSCATPASSPSAAWAARSRHSTACCRSDAARGSSWTPSSWSASRSSRGRSGPSPEARAARRTPRAAAAP